MLVSIVLFKIVSTYLSDTVFNFKVQKVILSRVGWPRHDRRGNGRTGGWRTVDSPAADRRLVREYIGQTGDNGFCGERQRFVTILHGVHHLQYKFGLPEHLQVVYAFLQDFRNRLFSPGLV